ncbi:DUF305 domain-containing protein [Pseudomonas yamanorum]|uniref:DUF305 domain-containing protein n=1 Tax=Pseudomonas yamanorum TaxID=515393 RepID=A0ABU1CXH1_9PSED|nr:DUF305 domain-containing protein [Pseudomonas yamanorum]MDR0191948.1 DUF305 domain-containing protein [Pseudomonas yamanorum]
MKINYNVRFSMIVTVLTLSLSAMNVSAQQPDVTNASPMGMSAGGMSMPHASVADTPATVAYKHNAKKMVQAIGSEPFTGDADTDFVAHMIYHHQGAVDQANVELKYGKDPEMRALAAAILKSQPPEIQEMKKWQAKRAVK